MSRIRRLLTIPLCITVTLLLALPPGLYWLGLSGVDGVPEKPLQLASKEQQALVWKRAHGNGVPRIAAINPYSFAMTLFVKKDPGVDPEQLIIWRLAAGYLMNHQRQKGMGWWHLSGAALTIWLSRHWTQEEILSAAVAASKYPEQAS